LCVNCKHVKEEKESVGPIPMWPFTGVSIPVIIVHRCTRPSRVSLVTGEVESTNAFEERKHAVEDTCGPHGKYWE